MNCLILWEDHLDEIKYVFSVYLKLRFIAAFFVLERLSVSKIKKFKGFVS